MGDQGPAPLRSTIGTEFPAPVLNPRPPLFITNQFTPSCRPASRLASRKRTFNITCCEVATCIAFTTGTVSAAMLLAI